MHFVVFSHGAICSFVMLMRWRRREEDDNDVNEVKITIRAECFRPIIIHSICKCACHPLCTYCCTFRLQEDCPDAKQLHLPLLAVKGTFFRPLTSALPIICSSFLVLSLQKWCQLFSSKKSNAEEESKVSKRNIIMTESSLPILISRLTNYFSICRVFERKTEIEFREVVVVVSEGAW